MNVIVICHWGRSGYNVLRALTPLGIKSYLITDDRARSLKSARGCKMLHHVPELSLADDATIIKVINDAHRDVGITSVIPTDVTASMVLARIRDRLLPPIFPMAPVETIHRLDDKWAFAQLCQSLGVDIPPTVYFAKNREVDAISLRFPLIVKPSSGYGQRGIVMLPDRAAMAAFSQEHSHDHGMVIQEFIDGMDWSLSVFALDGEVKNWAAWECPGQLAADYGVSRYMVTTFRRNDKLLSMVETLVAGLGFSGIANFDARLASDGRMLLLECNPRFFNRMLAARIGGGLNFVAAGLCLQQHRALCSGTYYPWQFAFTAKGARLLMTGEWRWRYLFQDVYEMVRDPLPPVIRKVIGEDRMT
jgi:predicted ATP-grasp superfamily ATP-dependent carboligase